MYWSIPANRITKLMHNLKIVLRDNGIEDEYIDEIDFAVKKVNDRSLFKIDHHEVDKMMKSINSSLMNNL